MASLGQSCMVLAYCRPWFLESLSLRQCTFKDVQQQIYWTLGPFQIAFPLKRPAGLAFQSEPLPDRNWAPGVWVRVRVWQHSLWQVVSFPVTPALFCTVAFVGPSLLRFLNLSKPWLVVHLKKNEGVFLSLGNKMECWGCLN